MVDSSFTLLKILFPSLYSCGYIPTYVIEQCHTNQPTQSVSVCHVCQSNRNQLFDHPHLACQIKLFATRRRHVIIETCVYLCVNSSELSATSVSGGNTETYVDGKSQENKDTERNGEAVPFRRIFTVGEL